MQGGNTGLGHVADDVAPLLLERRRDGEHPFGEAAAGGTVRAEAPLAPEHRSPVIPPMSNVVGACSTRGTLPVAQTWRCTTVRSGGASAF
jgi:hypothetical protein